ncbi:MAG TPA: hypothetical protein VNV16_11835 [Methylibium sp.]|nr:hypothetical protein [Methylibium sp.]
MSDKLREALKKIATQHGQWNNGMWAANIALEALAADDAARRKVRGEFADWAFDQPDFATMHPWDVARSAWQAATRAAAPQSAEPTPTDAQWVEEAMRLALAWSRASGRADLDATHAALRTHLSTRPQQAAPTEADRLDAVLTALRRLWPLFDKATKGYVFTTQRAGEVAADMEMLRAAMSAQAGGKEQGS